MSAPPPTLSGALRLANVNDFLTPAAACVLPVSGGALPAVSPAARREPPGSVLAPITPSRQSAASVTLSDCLSCSGCVTSAETVLLSSAGADALRGLLLAPPAGADRTGGLFVAVILSQQAVASIAAACEIPSLRSTAGKLSTFFKEVLHVDVVLDLAFARHFALEEAAHEFVARRRAGEKLVIASACPGWVTYAEKTQGDEVLRSVSRVRSPQAIAGMLVPLIFDNKMGKEPGRTETDPTQPSTMQTKDTAQSCKRTLTVTVMPCHDKKLEASRPEFTHVASVGDETLQVADIEYVLSANEVLQLTRELSVDLKTLKDTDLDPQFTAGNAQNDDFGSRTETGSGGYADYVLRHAAKELLGVDLRDNAIEMEKASRSGDLRSVTIMAKDGSSSLCFATAYGFRSLQSVLRKIKRGECDFDYIELMSCPGGCNNGGGQVDFSGDKHARTKHLERVESLYRMTGNTVLGAKVPAVANAYSDTLKETPGQCSALRTTYNQRKETALSAANDW